MEIAPTNSTKVRTRIQPGTLDQNTDHGWKLTFFLILLFLIGAVQHSRMILPEMCHKVLYKADEAVNVSVAANLFRNPWSPSIRLNSLIDEYTTWVEGPKWQHIPPLFGYVPLPVFWWDGRPTLEGARLAFLILLVLTGVAFILICSALTHGKPVILLAATVASFLFVINPFSQDLILGRAFGISDILLSFSVILSYWPILKWRDDQKKGYPRSNLCAFLYGLVIGFPIAVKSLLGGMPAFIWTVILVRERSLKKIFWAFLGLSLLPALEAIWLYLDSPSTFAQEIIVPILHLGNYEGGAMPWHFYLFYFCDHYLYRNITLATVVWIVIGLGAVASVAQMMRSQFRLDLASLSLVIFVFNLVAVTLVSTKSPSFLYQSLLPLLFFCTNLIFTNIGSVFRPFGGLVASGLKPWTLGLLGAVLLVQGGLWAQSYRAERVSPASYDSGIEGLLFKAGDQGYREGWGLRDLVLTGPYDGDLWGRFPFIILTGSESRTVKELKTWLEREDNAELKLRTKFDWIRRVDSNGQVESIRLALIQEGEISKSHFLKVPSE